MQGQIHRLKIKNCGVASLTNKIRFGCGNYLAYIAVLVKWVDMTTINIISVEDRCLKAVTYPILWAVCNLVGI